MNKRITTYLLPLVLGGCVSHPSPQDITGIWINQNAIDAALQQGNLRAGLRTYGMNQEWNFERKTHQAAGTNGFEYIPGKWLQGADGDWKVDNGSYTYEFRMDNKLLTQQPNKYEPKHTFQRPAHHAPESAPLGSSFRYALYDAYMGGTWKIISGSGKDSIVKFSANGQVEGLPGAESYTLCLGGDCDSMSRGNDSIVLSHDGVQTGWGLLRKNTRMEIFQSINNNRGDGYPDYTFGPRKWLLLKQ